MHQNPAFDLKEGTEDSRQELVARLREKTDSTADLAVKILLREPDVAWREFDRQALQARRSLVSLGVPPGIGFVPPTAGSIEKFRRLAQFEADPATVIPLPATGMRKSSGGPNVRAVVRTGDGLTWDQVRIEVGATRTILMKAPGQSGKYVFPPNCQMQKDHPVGMLMTLAATGEWRNPPLGSAEYERVSRAFRRLRKLLMALVPLPGDPFQPYRGAFVPPFQIGVCRDAARRPARTRALSRSVAQKTDV